MESLSIDGNATVNVHGGRFNGTVQGGRVNSSLTIEGGAFGNLRVWSGGDLSLYGTHFAVNGIPLEGLDTPGDSVSLDLSDEELITGTLKDGTPFAYLAYVDIPAINITEAEVDLATSQAIVDASQDPVPPAIRDGQTLLVNNGAAVHDVFRAGIGSKVNIGATGSVGDHFESIGATVVVNGGSIGTGFRAYLDSRVVINGGIVGSGFQVFDGAEVVLTRGTIGDASTAGDFVVHGGAKVTVLGGEIASANRQPKKLELKSGSEFTVVGTTFHMMGISEPGESRTRELSFFSNIRGTLMDGSEFVLNGDISNGANLRAIVGFPEDFCDFDGDAICDVSDLDLLFQAFNEEETRFDLNYSGLVDIDDIEIWLGNAGRSNVEKEYLFGDANLDGTVDAADLNAVGSHWLSETTTSWSHGDFNADGKVDALDLNEIGQNWLRQIPRVGLARNVPEPSTLVILAGITIALLQRKRRV